MPEREVKLNPEFAWSGSFTTRTSPLGSMMSRPVVADIWSTARKSWTDGLTFAGSVKGVSEVPDVRHISPPEVNGTVEPQGALRNTAAGAIPDPAVLHRQVREFEVARQQRLHQE